MSCDPELVMLYADGECSAEEAAQVEAALRESTDAPRAYARSVRQRLMLAEILSVPRAGQAEVPVLVVTGLGHEAATPKPGRRSRFLFWAGAAAAALLAAATGVWFGHRNGTPAAYVISGSAAAAVRQEIAYGRPIEARGSESVNLLLRDRSVVSLAPAGTMVVDAPRRLSLTGGEVRVACRKDPSRKFVVKAGAATVTALGTEFSVSIGTSPASAGSVPRFEDDTREGKPVRKLVHVAVFSGAVILANAAGQVRLEAGERGSAGKAAKPAKVKADKGKGNEDKLGQYVQELHDKGLRGKELAEAVREKINERKAAKDSAKNQGKGKGSCDGCDDGDCKGKAKGKGEGSGEGEGKKHQHQHGKGEGGGEGEGKKHQHGKGKGGGEGEGKKHQHGKGGNGKGKGGGGDNEPGAEDEEKGKGRGKGGGGGRGKGGGRGRR